MITLGRSDAILARDTLKKYLHLMSQDPLFIPGPYEEIQDLLEFISVQLHSMAEEEEIG